MQETVSICAFSKFVEEINKSNSRIYKINVLKKYKDSYCIKYFLKLVYDPFIIFGLSDKKLHKNINGSFKLKSQDSIIFSNIKQLFEYLKEHNTGTDVDINIVQQFKEQCVDLAFHELFDKIVTKNLQLGIDVKTINSVFPDLCGSFSVMLANKFFSDPSKIAGKSFAITTKIDGSRIIAIKENNAVKFYTRQGQLYEGLVDLEDEMNKLMPNDTCFDGELTLLDCANLASKEQYKKTMKLSRIDGEKHGLKMLVFDYMPAVDFRRQFCSLSYKERREQLEKIFTNKDFKFFNLLPILYCGKDTEKIYLLLDQQTKKGEEGIMINNLDAQYSFKRTWDLMKCKKMKDVDLRIVGFEEGSGKNKNMLGAILLSYKNNIVKCGSGFTELQRKEIWNNQQAYLNTLAEITYFEETENAAGNKSLRFPVFKDFRTDKIEADF